MQCSEWLIKCSPTSGHTRVCVQTGKTELITKQQSSTLDPTFQESLCHRGPLNSVKGGIKAAAKPISTSQRKSYKTFLRKSACFLT